MSEINFNDLLVEWIDSFATYKESDYSRRKDGTFDWIDWCTHGGEDFDNFMRKRHDKVVAWVFAQKFTVSTKQRKEVNE